MKFSEYSSSHSAMRKLEKLSRSTDSLFLAQQAMDLKRYLVEVAEEYNFGSYRVFNRIMEADLPFVFSVKIFNPPSRHSLWLKLSTRELVSHLPLEYRSHLNLHLDGVCQNLLANYSVELRKVGHAFANGLFGRIEDSQEYLDISFIVNTHRLACDAQAYDYAVQEIVEICDQWCRVPTILSLRAEVQG